MSSNKPVDREAKTDPPQPAEADLEGLARRVSIPVHQTELRWELVKGGKVMERGVVAGQRAIVAARHLREGQS